jgi:glycogen phosphorylase
MTTIAPKPARVEATGLKQSILNHMTYSLGLTLDRALPREMCRAVTLAIRDRIIDRLLETEQRYQQADAKRVYYLSIEFLIGRSLGNNLANLGLVDECREALADLGFDLHDIENSEVDAALGNGGLGRLAACFLDSLATMDLPGFGYGLNYEYGLFKQEIRNGGQIEKPDNWRSDAMPWDIDRPQDAVLVPIYGRIEHVQDRSGHYNPMWLDWKVVWGVPHDLPIVGYGGKTVNYLRLFSARASQELDMAIFNEGDYLNAVEQKVRSETISKVLYPSESAAAGRELRLIQEYFLVACSVRDIVRQYMQSHNDFDGFADGVAIQLNDTHPALAVAELMRLLVDEGGLEWDRAWEIAVATFAYTNHTLMPEALERWPVALLERVLPRHLQIIYEINRRLLEQVERRWPGDVDRMRRLSLVEEGANKQIRMAHLAIAGSHSVNGVAAVHSRLVKDELVPDFYDLWPDKFNNKTNGVTQRRWLLHANPGLADLITETIGDGWITDLRQLHQLELSADDPAFQDRFLKVKRRNKQRMADLVRSTTGVIADCDSLFDVQVKRIHEYKRQLLNVLHIIHEYLCLVEDGRPPAQPRTYIFAGKAAPGYEAAKGIIQLINDVARVVNADRRTGGAIKVAFVPDYRVSLAEVIFPSADLSEQISTAGMEASGTGNMKFALNGALTIGTLDGANIEIREEVGPENIFIFGLTVEEIGRLRHADAYRPGDVYQQFPHAQRILDALRDGRFCAHRLGAHEWLFHKLIAPGEPYFHLADLESYLQTHDQAGRVFEDRPAWAQKAILNTARIGKFSSDRTIGEYAREIWNMRPIG